jgi:hypothetical protein
MNIEGYGEIEYLDDLPFGVVSQNLRLTLIPINML